MVDVEPEYGFELYYGLLKEHLVTYGILSENQTERYSDGSIENLDVTGVSRVLNRNGDYNSCKRERKT